MLGYNLIESSNEGKVLSIGFHKGSTRRKLEKTEKNEPPPQK